MAMPFCVIFGLFLAVVLVAKVYDDQSDVRTSVQGLRGDAEHAKAWHVSSKGSTVDERLFARSLQTTTAYTVSLHLALLYLNTTVASRLETKDPNDELVAHFCKSVNYQVRLRIVQSVSLIRYTVTNHDLKLCCALYFLAGEWESGTAGREHC